MKNFFNSIRRRLFVFAITVISPDAIIMIADFNEKDAKTAAACAYVKGHKGHLIHLFATLAGEAGFDNDILFPALAAIASKKLEKIDTMLPDLVGAFPHEPVHLNKKQKTVN